MTVANQANMKRQPSFVNASGAEIPSYGVIMLQSDTTTDDTTPNFLGRMLFVQPNDVAATDPPKTFALNSVNPVTDGDYGKCVFGIDAPVWGRIESDSGDSTWDVSDPSLDWVGQEWGPVDGRWDVNIGGKGFFIQGPPDLTKNRILVRQVIHDLELQQIPAGECSCCPGACVCYPDDPSKITTDCGAVPCLLTDYNVVGNLPFSIDNSLTHDSGCDFLGDASDLILCSNQNYGSHGWKLTVGAAAGDSTLDLVNNGTGPGVPLKYVSANPFLPFCGNEFVMKWDCGLVADDYLKSIVGSWPPKVCVNPVGSTACTPCHLPSVTIDCCPNNPTSQQLSVTFSSSCADINGQTVNLTYVGATAVGPGNKYDWQGTMTLAGCGTVYVEFEIGPACVPGLFIRSGSQTGVLCANLSGVSYIDCTFASVNLSTDNSNGQKWNITQVSDCNCSCVVGTSISASIIAL